MLNNNAHRTPSVGDNLPAALSHPLIQSSLKNLSPVRQARTSPSEASHMTVLANRQRRSSAYRFFPRFGERGEALHASPTEVRNNHEQQCFNLQEGGGL
jgi:hypothetical protein